MTGTPRINHQSGCQQTTSEEIPMEIYYVFIPLAIHFKICMALVLNTLSTFEKGQTGVLVCDVPSFTAAVEISNSKNPGTVLTSCYSGICLPSNSGRYTYSTNASAVSVTISLSTQADDEATWTCTLTTTTPELANYTLQISSRPTTTEITSSNPSNGTNIDKVTLSATSYCFYPSVNTASLVYRIGTSGTFTTLSTTVTASSQNGSSKGCAAYEFEIVVSGLEITSTAYPVLSKKSNVYLTILFDHSVLGTFTPTNGPVGPYDFPESSNGGCNCPCIMAERIFCYLIEVLIILVLGVTLNVCGKYFEMKCIRKFGCAGSCVAPLCTEKNSPDSSTKANHMECIDRRGVWLFLSVIAVGIIFGVLIGYLATENKCCNCKSCKPKTGICFGGGITIGVLLSLIYTFCIFPVHPIVKWPEKSGLSKGNTPGYGNDVASDHEMHLKT